MTRYSLLLLAVLGCGKKSEAPLAQQQQQEKSDPWAAKGSSEPSGGAKKWYEADAPVGVWMGLDERLTPDLSGVPQTKLRLTTMVIWPDGRLSQDAPWAGLADFDHAAWERDVPTNASLGGRPGTYTRDGDGWRVTYQGSPEVTMTMAGDELRIQKAKLRRASDVTGATLEGTYTWMSNAEDPSLAGPGCQPLVTFTKDGKFENRGGFASTCPAGDSDPGKPGSGTYELRDFSLVLHYADGRTDKQLITARQNGDLHADATNAIIKGRVWTRRTGPTDSSSVAAAPEGGTTTYDAISFATPPGTLNRKEGLLEYTAQQGDKFCMTIVYAGAPSTGTLDGDFAADWKDIMLNGRTAEGATQPQQGKTPTGLAFAVAAAATTENANKARVYRALMVFSVGRRRATVMFIAPTEAQLADCKMEELIKSVRGA